MTIGTSFGSDSYTNWQYSIWRDGSEDMCWVTSGTFDIIAEMFASPNVNFFISTPEELEYNSAFEEEELDEEDSLETASQDNLQLNMFDI